MNKRKKEFKKQKLLFCAKITYPWMSSHVFCWKRGVTDSKKKELFLDNSDYFVDTFVPNIEKAKNQETFNRLLFEGITHIQESYESYQSNCFFTKYAKWVNSFLKMAFLTNSISLKEKYLHCPIDETVLNILGDNKTKWSKADFNQYNSIIKKINDTKKHQTIFRWELEQWNNPKIGG